MRGDSYCNEVTEHGRDYQNGRRRTLKLYKYKYYVSLEFDFTPHRELERCKLCGGRFTLSNVIVLYHPT